MTEQPDFERQRWEYELNRDYAQRYHDQSREFFYRTNTAAIEGANLALKMAVLINGGAAISLLTFIGNEKNRAAFAQIAYALTCFASGVVLAGVGFLLAYYTNLLTAACEGSKELIWERPYIKPGPLTETYQNRKTLCHWGAAIAGIGSLIVFVIGVYCASRALMKA
jgi:hypothetical protein